MSESIQVKDETVEADGRHFSWVLLRTWAPPRWVIPATWSLGAALALCAVAVSGALSPSTPAFALLCLVSPVLFTIDFAERRLPDVITLPLIVGMLLALVLGGALNDDWGASLRGLLSGVVVVAVFFVLFVIARGAFGFGDVKLGFSLGACLGTVGAIPVVFGLLSGMLLALCVGFILIVLRRATMKSSLALGPFLLVGTLAVMFTAV